MVVAEDSAEVERRTVVLGRELAPRTLLGSILVRQMALLSVRMERVGRQELANLAERVRHAATEFDEARLEEAERLFATLADQPRTAVRRLRSSPEGIDRLLLAWRELRAKLGGLRWVWSMTERSLTENLLGYKGDEALGSRLKGLSEAVAGRFDGLGERDGGGLDIEGRRAWARERLLERIDREITGLEEQRDNLDHDTIALDRAEAGDRALFDPSRPATLARRYEREAQRGFFQALREFREVEAEPQALPEPARPEPVMPEPKFEPKPEPLASSRKIEPLPRPVPVEPPLNRVSRFDPTSMAVAMTPDGELLAIGRAPSRLS